MRTALSRLSNLRLINLKINEAHNLTLINLIINGAHNLFENETHNLFAYRVGTLLAGGSTGLPW